ncbi:MAG: hypothetical protein JWN38_434 [Candidatus Saccharibacteria bacterium]|nr:hypothetical protein [Candidatus Saccharibacteria bacterium]
MASAPLSPISPTASLADDDVCYTRDMQVSFVKSQAEADNIRSFYFKPAGEFRYTAGQFIELTIPHDKPDSRGTRRWFTLSSSPSQDLLSITTKLNPEGSSFKRALQALEPGAELTMTGPMGDFVLPKLTQTPLIFVAGGIGITPFHSMFQWLADTGEQRPIKFIHAVSSEQEIIFQDTYEKAGIHATIIVKRPSAAWGGERGELNAEMIMGLEAPSDDTLVYVSGPEGLVESLQTALKNAGLKKHQLVGDFFPGYDKI